jgi:hypothetical protein
MPITVKHSASPSSYAYAGFAAGQGKARSKKEEEWLKMLEREKLQESKQSFQRDENALDRAANLKRQKAAQEFRAGESAIGREYGAEQASLGREFRSEESKLGREFAAGESVLSREARAEEAKLGREFRAGESKLGREYGTEQAELNRKAIADRQAQAFRRKTDAEKQYIKDKASEYQKKRKQIEDAYAGGEGRINAMQYNKAMEALQKSYSRGDVDVTSPDYSQIEKQTEQHPMITLEGGRQVPALFDSQGRPDPGKTALEYAKLQEKVETRQAKAEELRRKEIEKRVDDEISFLQEQREYESRKAENKGLNVQSMSPKEIRDKRNELMRKYMGEAERGPEPEELTKPQSLQRAKTEMRELINQYNKTRDPEVYAKIKKMLEELRR